MRYQLLHNTFQALNGSVVSAREVVFHPASQQGYGLINDTTLIYLDVWIDGVLHQASDYIYQGPNSYVANLPLTAQQETALTQLENWFVPFLDTIGIIYHGNASFGSAVFESDAYFELRGREGDVYGNSDNIYSLHSLYALLGESDTDAGLTARDTNSTPDEPEEPIMSLFTTIEPLGHTIIALSNSLTTQAEALAWAQHLEFVSGPTEQHDAILIVPFTDIEAAEAFAALASAKTSYRIVAACYHGATGQEAEIAASIAAALADSADPALPFNGVNLTGLTPVEPAYVLTKTRIEQALHNGVCMIATGADGVPEIVRAVTTYQQTPEGEEDDLLLDVNGALVLAYVRKTMRSIAKAQPRRKNTASARRDLRSAFLAGCMKLDAAEILKNVDARKDALTVDADVNDEYRVNARIPSDWVRGMHIIATTLDVF